MLDIQLYALDSKKPNGRSAYSTTRISKKRAPWKKVMFKVLDPSMEELQELKLLSHKDQVLHYGF